MKETSWEYVGRTVDEATQIALEELGLERDDIHVEIIEEPQKGFLGLGGKEARIRVDLIGEWEVQGKISTEREAEDSAPEALEDERAASYGDPDDMQSFSEGAGKPVEMVQKILSIMQIDAAVEGRDRDDAVVVDVWGEDVALLIGRGGSTLDALQYLVNVGCRRTGEVTKKIVIDVEGYRKRRKVKVEKLAEQVAERVVSQGKSVELDPMSASERKIVHMALREFGGVWTESTGDGPERRVVVHPGDRKPDVPRETF